MRALVLIFCVALSAQSYAAEPNAKFALSYWQDESLYEKMTMTPVTDHGLIAELYTPKVQLHDAAILALGACTAGNPRDWAQGLANAGYVTMALFYCGENTQTEQLAEVPLEYMKTAIDWLRTNPNLKIKHVGVVGGSQGAQAALITAATYPEVTAVVAGSPSNFITQALGPLPDRAKSAPATSSWSLRGMPLPYRPHDGGSNLDSNPEAYIAVERINGPVLLISGTEDKAWPASIMSDKIMARLKANNFRFPYVHLRYPDAGHAMFAADDPVDPIFAEKFRKAAAPSAAAFGGTAEGNIAAQKDYWPKVLSFLDTAFRAS